MLLHPNTLCQIAEWAFVFITWERGRFLTYKTIVEHTAEHRKRIQRNRNNHAHIADMEFRPNIPISPNLQVSDMIFLYIFFQSIRNGYQRFEMRIGSTAFGIQRQ